jgi:dolichyl-diphosphooligosaccharide--protein glycosyltransferase
MTAGPGPRGPLAALARDAPRPLRLGLAGGLALVLAVRLVPLPDVFVDGLVVLSSNDPYLYRVLVDRALAGGLGPSLSADVRTGEPLLVVALWLVALPASGSPWATGAVVAVYPVVAALATGLLVYGLAARAAGDARVGLAALALFATTPAHAYRSGLGMADHHAFDYLWLALTAYALVTLLSSTPGTDGDGRDRRTRLFVVALGAGVAGQVLAWEAGPLLVAPVGVAVAASAPLLLARGRTDRLRPVATGTGLAAAAVGAAHLLLGWHTTPVAGSVALLFAGCLGVAALAALAARLDLSWPALAVVEAAVAAAAAGAAWVALPDLVAALEAGIGRLTRDSGIGEASSLIEDYGAVFGPLIILGFAPFLGALGVPGALGRIRRTGDPAPVVVLVYTAHFGALTLVQRRFGGELAAPLAALAGLGLVGYLGWLDLARPLAGGNDDGDGDEAGASDEDGAPVTVPDRTRLALVGGLGAVLVGTGGYYSALIHDRLTIDPRAVAAARAMRRYADRRGWSTAERFVLSEWGRNRMYNYLVGADARSYAFARATYEEFLFDDDATRWYRRLRDRVGFVVTRDLGGIANAAQIYGRLQLHMGSADAGAEGTGHYRAVFASEDGAYRAFALVPGATIAGPVGPGVDRVATTVSIPGAEFEYVRTVEPTGGPVAVTVAHPGRYRVGDRTVTVAPADVYEGRTVRTDG